jgi:hypothetical protein
MRSAIWVPERTRLAEHELVTQTRGRDRVHVVFNVSSSARLALWLETYELFLHCSHVAAQSVEQPYGIW